MEPEINCSELCDSIPGQELDRSPLHDLCRTITSSHYSSKTISSLSPVLLGIVWTFLSCGLLLIVFFLGFTIRCRNNRIVKMSSPNLNIVTLLGSCLTYSSVYLFGIQDRDALVGGSMETLIQIRLSMLCIGTSLVFGPILGKSWRLYKVFTQRVPDKRVALVLLALCELANIWNQYEGEQDAQRDCCLAQVWAESGMRDSDYREAVARKQLFLLLEPSSSPCGRPFSALGRMDLEQ